MIILRNYIMKLQNTVKKHQIKRLPHISANNNSDVNKVIPGWNEHVKEYAEKAKFWHYIWKKMLENVQEFQQI